MLNIGKTTLNQRVSLKEYSSYIFVEGRRDNKYFNRFLAVFSAIGIVILFLPWTQNVSAGGYVTTLKPSQRPQTIQSPIPGRIEQWFVNEGDYVKKGDTILFISEIKNEYQDPQLVERTIMQRDAKANSVKSYERKVDAVDQQIVALINERKLKLEQAENKLRQAELKVKTDSIDLVAANTNLDIARTQFNRAQALYDDGLKSRADLELKKLQLQEDEAKLISQENKLLTSRNEILNARLEIGRIATEYSEKISKAESEKYTAESAQFDTAAQVSKLDNETTNYAMRNKMLYVTSPQNGYINKALKGGIGETFDEGEKLVGIMPSDYDLAVETFVEPIDLPLLHINEKVRIQFDGWPAIVFNGWPDASFGTYGGRIVAIENFISPNGKYRILIAPDPGAEKWPTRVRVGSGARTIALLNDVPIWYELWRKLNGFPPEYYNPYDSSS
ncbi:MAG: biotin/lipoyl-binding protein [Flavobacteriaceae bacterium]|nr:biotin/lipoyl-binding protein [Flavobacteriaceae bacterium]